MNLKINIKHKILFMSLLPLILVACGGGTEDQLPVAGASEGNARPKFAVAATVMTASAETAEQIQASEIPEDLIEEITKGPELLNTANANNGIVDTSAQLLTPALEFDGLYSETDENLPAIADSDLQYTSGAGRFYVLNDLYKYEGSFKEPASKGEASYTIKWKQIKLSAPAVGYPAGSHPVDIWVEGQLQERSNRNYINNYGKINYMRGGGLNDYTTKSTFLSDGYKTLQKANVSLISEHNFVRTKGWSTATFDHRNANKKIVTTQGGLKLAAVIHVIGKRKVAQKTTPLATKTSQITNNFLKSKFLGSQVQHAVAHSGMVVVGSKSRGRRLAGDQGECSKNVGQCVNHPGQDSGDHAAQNAIPLGGPRPPWYDHVMRNYLDPDFQNNTPSRQNQIIADHIDRIMFDETPMRRSQVRDVRNYFSAIAFYLAAQNSLFPDGLNDYAIIARLDREVVRIVGYMNLYNRNGQLTPREYAIDRQGVIDNIEKIFRGRRIRFTPEELVGLIERFPGLQPTENVLRTEARRELNVMEATAEEATQWLDRARLPGDIIDYILLLAAGMFHTTPKP
jgi:hypothetical protein